MKKLNNSEKRMNKRGQVTIFIILALAIVAVLIIIFLKRADIGLSITPSTPLDSLKQCISSGLVDSMELISSQGGSLAPKLYYYYEGINVSYLCYSQDYYQPCIMQNPLVKQSIESEIKKDMEPKIKECFESQKSLLQGKGYAVSYKNPNISVELIPNNIILSIESDLKITKATTQTYKSIKIDQTSKLYELSMITSSIINYEARYGASEIMNYMMYYPELRVEKNKQGDGTTVYILTDKKTGEVFRFATRSYVIAPGLTGN